MFRTGKLICVSCCCCSFLFSFLLAAVVVAAAAVVVELFRMSVQFKHVEYMYQMEARLKTPTLKKLILHGLLNKSVVKKNNTN